MDDIRRFYMLVGCLTLIIVTGIMASCEEDSQRYLTNHLRTHNAGATE